ncbi:MAG: UPF0280 family protein [Alphaproteobacteria bacterium]
MMGLAPARACLPGGRRHYQHGPIDLVIEAFGAAPEIALAYEQAWTRFAAVLGELAGELPALRQPLSSAGELRGPIAIAMGAACAVHEKIYLTPMAAVAGAVGDAVLAALTAGRKLTKAYVNNGGDIALYLAPGQALRAGIVVLEDRGPGETPGFGGQARIEASSGVRGIATSGWRGRSHSLGIADSVTVLAGDAAMADVCATLIANAVNCEDPAIRRAPASSLDADSDLGDRLVTTGVGRLARGKVERALAGGMKTAGEMKDRGFVADAVLTLQGSTRSLGAGEDLTIPDVAALPALAGPGMTGIERRVGSHDVS